MKALLMTVCTLTLVMVAPLSHAVCDSSTLNAAYGFEVIGVTEGNSFHAVGVLTFDGAGRVRMDKTRSSEFGVTEFIVGSGTYSVSALCNAVVSITLKDTLERIRIDAVLVGDGSDLKLVLSDAVNMDSASGSAKRIDL